MSGPVRGIRNVEGKLLVVSGNQLYQISNTGVAIPRGTIPGVGRVAMAHNQHGLANQVAIDNGSARYVYNTQTLALQKVTDPSFPGSIMPFFVDGYLGFVEPQGRYWGHSDLGDGLDYNTFDQYEAEGQPDRIVSAIVSHREVLVFGRNTIEPYVNQPVREDGRAPFQRASNTVIECGCAAKFTPKLLDNTVFWLDDKRIVRRLDAYTPIRISHRGIETALSECTQAQISEAYALTWEDDGHKVYYLTVPGKFTFGYDVLSGEWSERSAFGLPHWPVCDVAYWQDRWIAGSTLDGKLYELDWFYSMDADQPLIRERETGVLTFDRKPFSINEIELLFNVGSKVTVPVPFPYQPRGPDIEGEAPDGLTGEAYSFAYTLTPGGAPIVRTVLLGVTLPAGWGWNEATATISNAAPSSDVVITLSMRAYDANGLYADHEDQFVVAQQSFLLVTGAGKDGGGPFASSYALEPVEFAPLPTGIGADLAGGAPWFHEGVWLVTGASENRYSADNLASFATGTMPFTSIGYRAAAGEDGWISSVSGGGAEHEAASSSEPPASFTLMDIGVKRGEATLFTKQARRFGLARFTGGKYYIAIHDNSCLARSEAVSPEWWEAVYNRGDDGNANSGITTFYDVIEFKDALYATLNKDISYPRSQLRRSTDGGITWPEILIDEPDAGGPWQMETGNGELLVLGYGSSSIWSSADDFVQKRSTGIATGGLPYNRPQASVGRMIQFASGRFFIVSGDNEGDPLTGNKWVSTVSGLEVSAPQSLPLSSVRGIAAGVYTASDDE